MMKPLKDMTIREIAIEIHLDWKNVYFGAAPYLEAMLSLNTIDDHFHADDARSIVLYFLCNASTWRGPVAREIKAHLKKLCK